MGSRHYKLADYFDSCRAKRNITDYNFAGGISELEADELIREAEDFFEIILTWLNVNYSNLLEK